MDCGGERNSKQSKLNFYLFKHFKANEQIKEISKVKILKLIQVAKNFRRN